MRPHLPTASPVVLVSALAGVLLAISPGPATSLAEQSSPSPIELVASELSRKALSRGVTSIWVRDLEDPAGGVAGPMLADELARELLETHPALSICDRDTLLLLLEEHELQSRGMIAPEARSKLGRFCGPDALLEGTIYRVRRGLRVTVEIIDIETAETLVSETLRLPASWPDDVPGGHSGTDRAEELAPVPGADPKTEDPSRRHGSSGALAFELRNCTFIDDFVRCVVSVHNRLPSESYLAIRADSVLYDTDGQPYPVRSIRLAEGRYDATDPDGVFGRDLPPDSRVQVELIFTDVSRHKKKVQTLSLHLEGRDNVHFRDFFFDRIPRR